MTQQLVLSQPIRDLEVRYIRQLSGCSAFAIVAVDLEPATWNGVELAMASDLRLDFDGYDWPYESVLGYLEALARGITEELATRPDLDMRVKVVLRRVVFHMVDSNEMAFLHAGRLVVRRMIERLTGIAPE